MIVIGVVLIVLALVVSAAGGHVRARFAGTARIPLWRDDPSRKPPRRALLLQVLAVIIAGVGALLLSPTLGPPAYFLLILPSVVSLVTAAFHNRRVEQA